MWDWVKVSIHAPARGATRSWGRSKRMMTCFNPRARTGRDAFRVQRRFRLVLFQSTRPHGARLALVQREHIAPRRFNPRARTGRDLIELLKARATVSFNPRARTGRDPASTSTARLRKGFQSTRPHGARPHPPNTLIHRPKDGMRREPPNNSSVPTNTLRVSLNIPIFINVLPCSRD